MNLKNITVVAVVGVSVSGCVSNPPKTEVLSSKFTQDFHLPAMPVDQHYIGTPWSKKFGGAIKNRVPHNIDVVKERSTDGIHAELTNGISASLGLKAMGGSTNMLSGEMSDSTSNKAEGLELISPRSPAEIEYKPGVLYVSEALRLKNYKLSAETVREVGVGLSLPGSGVSAGLGGGGRGASGETGKGLVVAYKLRKVTEGSLQENEDRVKLTAKGSTHLSSSLGDFEKVRIRSKIKRIKNGSGEDFTQFDGLAWACDVSDVDMDSLRAAVILSVETRNDRNQTARHNYAVPMNQGKECDSFGALDTGGKCVFEKCQFPYVAEIDNGLDPVTDKLYQRHLYIDISDATLSNSGREVLFDGEAALKTRMFDVEIVKNPNVEQEIKNSKQRMKQASKS